MKLNLVLLLFAAVFTGCVEGPRETPTNPSPHPQASRWPGAQPDGSVLLPNQWSLRPVGRQAEMGDFPINIAVHPGGRFAAVLHCGYSAHEIRIVDILSGQVVSRSPIRESFYG